LPAKTSSKNSSNIIVPSNKPIKIDNVSSLVLEIDKLYILKERCAINLQELTSRMLDLFSSVDLMTSEINKYTFWDSNKPYTRNLVASDNKNYSLLLLCWTPGKESKIHNHPGEGCFMKTVRGCIRENRYSVDNDTGEIKHANTRFLSENQSNIYKYLCRLYTPPFKSCLVWAQSSSPSTTSLKIHDSQEAIVGFFSVFGVRTPHLEGSHSSYTLVMKDLLIKTKKLHSSAE
jgi:cysteine dioxygenase